MSLLIIYLILVLGIILSTCISCCYKEEMVVEAHKLLSGNGNDNGKFTSAIIIPNHTVSWAVYQTLNSDEGIDARFYKFNNTQINSSFYAQIIIPKIDQFVNFTPTLILLEPKSYTIKENGITNVINENKSTSNNNINDTLPFGIPTNYQIMINKNYNDTLPSPTIYEPFTQTSYWERQEINSKLYKLGTYYIVVYNSYDNSDNNVQQQNSAVKFGKFSLAVGKVEDFSILDLLVLIPYSWLSVKIFFNDYWSLTLGITIFVSLVIVMPIVLILRRKRNG
ncbi:MAG TPA: hypothetical protein VJR94_06325 [Candidatus Nitrosocosmicus sp.]|nr:hypothetical protein [Candidatus Nitrosocosmicus sp.]